MSAAEPPRPTADPTAAAGPARATIDAGLLYWTLLPADSGGSGTDQQLYSFERFLPVPVESLHVVRARLRDGRSLLVGVEPERLRAHLAGRKDLSAATWVLIPDRIPEHLGVPDPSAALAKLNLLQGRFEPAQRRRVRRRRDLAVSLGLVLALVLALVGVERRVMAATVAAEAMQRSGQELLAETLGPNPGPLAHHALLTQELRRLEQAASGPLATQLDTVGILQQLWAAWPTEVRCQVDTLSLAADRLVIRGSVPTLADAERVAKASPTITIGEAVFQAAPLQAEQTARGAGFLITWHLQSSGRGGRP